MRWVCPYSRVDGVCRRFDDECEPFAYGCLMDILPFAGNHIHDEPERRRFVQPIPWHDMRRRQRRFGTRLAAPLAQEAAMTMMPGRVEKLLDAEHVIYRTIAHRREYTSQHVAGAAHVSGRKLAKVVALRSGQGGWILAVVPATCHVDLEALTFWTDLSGLRLATETEMARRFPDCEPGAVPPFEQLHDVPVLLDDTFRQSDDLYFEDGTHERLVEMKVADFMRVSAPEVLHFSVRAQGH